MIGEYLAISDLDADGVNLLQNIQGYGTFVPGIDANGHYHIWQTGTTTDSTAGIVLTQTSPVTRMNLNPTINFKVGLYPKTTGDSRVYAGFYVPSVLIPSSDSLGNTAAYILIGWRTTDTNIQVFHSNGDGATAASVVDTTIVIPAALTIYFLSIKIITGNSFEWMIRNASGTKLASGTISTNIPSNTSNLNIHAVTQNPTGVSKNIAFWRGTQLRYDR